MGTFQLPLNESTWTIDSNSSKTKALGITFGILGLLILWVSSHITIKPESESDQMAIFLLGVLLVGLAIGVVIFSEVIKITVDEKQKRLLVTRQSFRGHRLAIHSFSSIKTIEVFSIGKSHRGIVTWHLNIVFKDARTLKTQFWSTQYSETMAIANRLSLATGAPCGPDSNSNPVNIKAFIISVAGAILIYCTWYKYMVGPFCSAMWFGTAPIMIIGISFLAIFRISRKISGL